MKCYRIPCGYKPGSPGFICVITKEGPAFSFNTDPNKQTIELDVIPHYNCDMMYFIDREYAAEYSKFLEREPRYIKSLAEKTGFQCENFGYAPIAKISGFSMEYFSWAIRNMSHTDSVSLSIIGHILRLAFDLKGMLHGLKKKSVLAYNGLEDAVGLLEELTAIGMERRVKKCISLFGTKQKTMLRNMKLSSENKRMMLSLLKLSNEEKRNFIKRVTPFSDTGKIFSEMSYVVADTIKWDKEWVKTVILRNNKVNAEIVFDKGDRLVVRPMDFETMRFLSKATPWCIGRDHGAWDSYLLGNPDTARQYIAFDFSLPQTDRMSTVGFTEMFGSGITHMHDFKNDTLMATETSPDLLPDLITKKAICDKSSLVDRLYPAINTITPYEMVKAFGLDASLVEMTGYGPKQWDKNTVLRFLDDAVSDRYSIIGEDDDTIALMFPNRKALVALGGSRNFSMLNECEIGSDEIVVYMDFTKDIIDARRYLVCSVDALCKRGNTKYANMTVYPLTMRRILSRYYGTEALDEAPSAADEYASLMQSMFFDEAAKVLSSERLKTELFYNMKDTRLRIHAAWDDYYLLMTSIPCEHIMGCGCDIGYLFNEDIAIDFVAKYKNVFEYNDGLKITREDNMAKIEQTLRYIIAVFHIKNEIYRRYSTSLLTGRGAEFLKAIGLDPYMFKKTNRANMGLGKVTSLALDFI